MYVSPRFRDIFSAGPVRTRHSDREVGIKVNAVKADARERAPDAEAVWLEITAAHRRAARAFTPTSNRASDLAV